MPRTPERDTDRGLLCGILAQRRGYISAEAFLRALHAWSDDPAKPIRGVLTELGGLSASHEAELETVVDQRLPGSVGRASQSTADYRSQADTADPGEVAQGDPHKTRDTGSPGRSGPSNPFASTEMRYRLVRFHAAGGRGQVSVALDKELNREIALKEIQERYADDDASRSRFLFEAEVTGGLEHPGIVPVYSLGAYADGRPFYAMRFIRGRSLKQSITEFHKTTFTTPARRAAEFRNLIERFKAVCLTMDYAHSRRVIHRDLKPENVMLGDYGETLVVDWGLAKRLDPDAERTVDAASGGPPIGASSDATHMGRVMGTPPYMSPEQAAGRIDQLGPASDVYSLGATLYSLLTGHAPVRDLNVKEVLKKVEAGEIQPPRQARPEVPRALEAICLRAMALKPEERYPTPGALADDLDKWLADAPVAAYAEPWTVRTWRWISRHRTLVISGAAILVAALASLAVIVVLLNGKNTELENAKQQAVDQKNEAVALFRLSEAIYGEMAPNKSAADFFESAAIRTQRLVDEHPDNAQYQRILALAQSNLGLWHKHTGNPDEA
jgi:serine/threonine-protein kinase